MREQTSKYGGRRRLAETTHARKTTAQICSEIFEHLHVTLFIDSRGVTVLVFKKEGPDDSFPGDGRPGCGLGRIKRGSRNNIQL